MNLLVACSGPGAGQTIHNNIVYAQYQFLVVAMLALASILFWLGTRRQRGLMLTEIVLMIIHPAWTISALHGDCGYLKAYVATGFTVLAATCFALQVALWQWLMHKRLQLPCVWVMVSWLSTTSFLSASDLGVTLDVVLGPVTKVYKPGDRHEMWFPDAHFPFISAGDENNMMFWYDRTTGARPDQQQVTPGAKWPPSGEKDDLDGEANWLVNVFRPFDHGMRGVIDNGLVVDRNYLVGFSHAENDEWYSSRVLWSYDNGLTWDRGTDASHALIYTPLPASNRTGGMAGFSVVVFDDRTDPKRPRYVGIGKQMWQSTDIIGGRGWFGWRATPNQDDDPFAGTFDFPGRADQRDAHHGKAPDDNPDLGRIGNWGWTTAAFYNTYITGRDASGAPTPGKWIALYCKFGDYHNVYAAASDDLLHWQDLGAITTLEGNSAWYFSVIGSSDQQSGQHAWLYYKDATSPPALTARAISFINTPAVDVRWTGTAGDRRIANPANWAPANRLNDEQPRLVFADAAAQTLKYDLPRRIRGIEFTAEAGAHTLEATTSIQLEGDLVNRSSNTQTILSDINARLAVIQLRAEGGDIDVRGRLDMHGLGGAIIDTAADRNVHIVGPIVNTPPAEFIASANPARLIKRGPGTLTLSAEGHSDGRTEVHAGVLRLKHPAALRHSVVELHEGAKLEIDAAADQALQLGGLHGPGALDVGPRDLTLGHDNTPDCYGAALTGALSGRGTLIKRGASAQSLAGQTRWTGPIRVFDGELDIDGMLKHEGEFTVAAGASLCGRGTIDTAQPIRIAGALRPGSQFSPAGVLTIHGDVKFEAGSRCVMTIGQRKGRWDHVHSRLTLRKDVDLSAATLALRIADAKFEPKAGAVIVLVKREAGASQFGQVIDQTGRAQAAEEGARIQLAGRAARLTYQAQGDKDKAAARGGRDVAIVFE